jgi:hypothetical protein
MESMALRRRISALKSTLLILSFCFLFAGIVYPQSDAEQRAVAAQARVAEAEARTAEANARSAEAGSRRSNIENRKAELELLAAKTAVEGNLIESDISAYKAVACAAADINRRVNGLGTRIDTLVVYSPRFARSLTEYSMLMGQLDLLSERYSEAFEMVPEKLPPQSPSNEEVKTYSEPQIAASRVISLPSVRSLALDTLSLFKTEVSIEGKIVNIGREEFIAKVVSGLNVEVYYPDKIIPFEAGKNSRLIRVFNDLVEYRLRSSKIIATVSSNLRLAEDYVNSAEGDDRLRAAKEYRNAWITLETRLPALDKMYDSTILAFFPAFGAGGDEGNQPGPSVEPGRGQRDIIAYLQAESFSKLLSANAQKQLYWLDVNVTKAGSNMRNKSSAIFDIFTGGKRISFSGGSIANYRIFGFNGQIIAADTILSYMPFKRSKKIAGYDCVSVQTIP